MRISGGEARGRRLKGAVSPGTRATTERVRAAIFNILGPVNSDGCRVLDLYAGSGSLGIEALSRGAAWADFVERDRRQCEVIESNLDATGFDSQAAVHRADVLKALPSLAGGYQIILLDPPYRMDGLEQVLTAIGSQEGLVIEGGVVIAGYSKRREIGPNFGKLRRTVHRQYGDNVVDFFSCQGEINAPGETTAEAPSGEEEW